MSVGIFAQNTLFLGSLQPPSTGTNQVDLRKTNGENMEGTQSGHLAIPISFRRALSQSACASDMHGCLTSRI